MTRFLTAIAAAALLGCGPAAAQVGGIGASPLGMTSPLGIGPAFAGGPTGIPLGATELASPGVSPMTVRRIAPGALGSAAATACSTMAGANSAAVSRHGSSERRDIRERSDRHPARAPSSTVAAWRGPRRAHAPDWRPESCGRACGISFVAHRNGSAFVGRPRRNSTGIDRVGSWRPQPTRLMFSPPIRRRRSPRWVARPCPSAPTRRESALHDGWNIDVFRLLLSRGSIAGGHADATNDRHSRRLC